MKSLRIPLVILFAAVATFGRAAGESGPQLGLQSWTCRNMTFDQTVEFAVKHRVKYIEFIALQHLDPAAPAEENLKKKAILEKNGLVAYSFGVNKPTLDQAANRKLFEFAKLMGMKVIAVEPANVPAIWDSVEQLVKEYDIKVAIHNHNRDSVYGDPSSSSLRSEYQGCGIGSVATRRAGFNVFTSKRP